MLEAVVALFVFFGGGLAWLAWNHPKAYDAVSQFLIPSAFVVAAAVWGLHAGYGGGVDALRKFLNPQGVIEAEKLLLRVNERTALLGGFAAACAIGMVLLGGLRFLPRGKD